MTVLKLIMKIVIAPVILLLTLAIWICVGLVYVSLAASDGVWVRTLKLGSDRERVRTAASSYALDMVRRYLTGLPVA